MAEQQTRLTVKVRSPFVYCLAVTIALNMMQLVPLAIFSNIGMGLALGTPLVMGGAILFTWGWRVMRSHQVHPNYGPVEGLIAVGPYAFTRNPLYLALTITYIGIGLANNTYWHLILLPLLIGYMHYGIIRPEEGYLEGLFGPKYLAYKHRVRRWI